MKLKLNIIKNLIDTYLLGRKVIIEAKRVKGQIDETNEKIKNARKNITAASSSGHSDQLNHFNQQLQVRKVDRISVFAAFGKGIFRAAGYNSDDN